MSSINVNVRLRPIRFGFLVRPNDKVNILKIMQINTVLWGGVYNPIIPFFTRVPKWWDKYLKGCSAKQIIDGYLDYFEPDFIVESEPGLAKNTGYNQERVILLSEMLAPNGDEARKKSYGLTVNHLYRDLYKKEFQFVHREKPRIIIASANKNQFKLFSACIFGDFPKGEEFDYFETNYDFVFDPERLQVSSKNLSSFYEEVQYSPLNISNSSIMPRYNSSDDLFSPTLFILDAYKPRDLIDYWNLRAIRKKIIAVPKQWLEEMSGFCNRFILKNYQPLVGNPAGVMIQPTALFSRSIEECEAKDLFDKHIKVNKNGANTLQLWYPPFWKKEPRFTARNTRPVLISKEESTEVFFDQANRSVKFKTLSPDFVQKSYGNEYRWVNVVSLKEYGIKDSLAIVFPNEYKQFSYPKLCVAQNEIIPSTEGLVIFQKFTDVYEYWQLMSGDEAFRAWFEQRKISVSFSPSGKSTKQIIETLGGVENVWCIANKEIINFFDEIARSEGKAIKSQLFKNKIDRFKNKIFNSFSKDRQFEMLVKNKVVEPGLEIKCNLCDKCNWYPLRGLSSSLLCEFCLKIYDFPVNNPNKCAKWAYRLLGPFSQLDYARGGYAAVLGIHFFSSIFSPMSEAQVTWSSGVELNFGKRNEKLEIDYLIWYQKKSILQPDCKTQLIFGEAKTFCKFARVDVDRMRYLSEQFPGSFLVFSTLNDKLSKNEVDLIRKLASWGRVFLRNGVDERRANVIVLTGGELFSDNISLDNAWKKAGGKYKGFSDLLLQSGYDLEVLADITQQIYLGMQSYSEDFRLKIEKKRKRKV